METIRSSVAAQSKVLSQAADEILSRQPVAERRFVPLSTADAVLRYAADFIPSWAGAIAIDLLPAVLVFVLAVVHGAIRRQSRSMPFAERITAAELLEALAVQQKLVQAGVTTEDLVRMREEREAEGEDAEQTNITSLDLASKTVRKGPTT